MVGDQGEIWDAVGAWCWSGCWGSRASERMENDRYFVTYRPLQPVNRDAMAAFLYRMAGSPAVRLPAASRVSSSGYVSSCDSKSMSLSICCSARSVVSSS